MKSNTILHGGLYEVLEKSATDVVVRLADASHPVFKAHFENNPLLPGFMQLDIIAAVLGKEIDGVTTAKFMKPVLPETVLNYSIKEGPKGVRITAKDDAKNMVCDAKVRWHDI